MKMEQETSMIILNYLNELNIIREILEQNDPFFPDGQCHLAARAVKRILGLEELAGLYIVFDYPQKEEWHAWNYDPALNLYVDITQDQFSDCNDKISILPVDTPLLIEIPDNTASHRSLKDEEICPDLKKIKRLYNRKISHFKG